MTRSRQIQADAGQGAFPLVLVGCVLLSQLATAFAAVPIQFAAQNAELAISEISERTLRIELAPLDEQGRPAPAMPSTVLVPFPSMEEFRARELVNERE